MSLAPLHPQFVHLPLALAVLLPLICLAVMVLVLKKKLPAIPAWGLVVGLQVLATAGGYLAMELGERDEEIVEDVVGKAPMHEHEERAEMFVAASVAASVVGIATLLIPVKFQLTMMGLTLACMLGQSFLGYRVGQSGGELVYVHKAANAYKTEAVQGEGLLPTPGQQTSESATPGDDNDYSSAESSEEEDSEEEKDQ